MKEKKFSLKYQDAVCTFKTFRTLMYEARKKCNGKDLSLKEMLNAGLVTMLPKSENEIRNILKKAQLGGESE